MKTISRVEIKTIRMDGVGTQSEFLAQLAADILGVPVEKVNTEDGVLGAVFMAGLASGYWESIDEVANLCPIAHKFVPRISTDERDASYQGWLKAVKRAGGWLKN
jgi:glycerol kinase